MRELKGKTAVITGGASGIGLAMAERFGREGMRLVVADVQADALASATTRLQEQGFEAVGVRTDVTDYGQVEALREAAVAAFGGVQLLVNNAGVSITGPTWRMSLDDWRWVHGVNVWGVIHGVKAFTQLMIDAGEPAHIVNVASLAAFNGTGEHAPYCSSKAACLSISQALNSELIAADTRVGVSVVCPGMVDTAIHQSWRNRPAGDRPWSDREWTDPAHRAVSDRVQGAGVAPELIAEATLKAIVDERFYVFVGEGSRTYVETYLRAAIDGTNPPVLTWGPDRRPDAGSRSADG